MFVAKTEMYKLFFSILSLGTDHSHRINAVGISIGTKTQVRIVNWKLGIFSLLSLFSTDNKYQYMYICYRPHPKDDGRLYFQSVHISWGGGVPGLRFLGRLIQPWMGGGGGGGGTGEGVGGQGEGGILGLRFLGRLIQPWTGRRGRGVPGLRFSGRLIQPWMGGVPDLSKEKNFWHQIWLDTCSDWKKNFFVEGPPPQ